MGRRFAAQSDAKWLLGKTKCFTEKKKKKKTDLKTIKIMEGIIKYS